MQLINKSNKGFSFLLCVIDIYGKYTQIIPLKDERGTTVTNTLQNFLKESNCCEAKSKGRKPNNIWIDKGSTFYNRSMKSWIEKNDIEIYSKHNEGKSVVPGRFIEP